MSDADPSLGSGIDEMPAPPPAQHGRWRRFGPLLSKIALELFIVFVGVSAAFAVENYRDVRAQHERRQVVYRALDRELRQMAETHGPILQRQMTEQLAAWDSALVKGEKPLPPVFRIRDAERPPTGVWDAAVATGTIELIDPELMFELARFYTRAETVGDLYQRYSTAAQVSVWSRVDEGRSAFWQPDGQLRPEIKTHVQRLRDFRDMQGKQVQGAVNLRKKLKKAAGA